MKKIAAIWIVCCLFNQTLPAQDLVQKKYIIYKTTITGLHGTNYKGFIATMDDTTVYMTKRKFALTFEYLSLKGLQKYDVSEIDRISMRSASSVKNGLLIGGIGGLLTGAIAGYVSTSNTNYKQGFQIYLVTPAEASLIGAVVGAGAGCLIGAGIGALSHKVFKIKGKKENLMGMHEAMLSTLY
jgi:hypothetical protein